VGCELSDGRGAAGPSELYPPPGVRGSGENPGLFADAVAEATAPGPAGPAEVELSDPVVSFVEPNRVKFEVRYRFIQGRPSKYYLCEISFPGTANHGAKPMDRWEFKPEGVIRDRVALSQPPVQTFEIRLSEADSPQDGYKLISNVVRGPVQ
jgi:hypothetical protein